MDRITESETTNEVRHGYNNFKSPGRMKKPKDPADVALSNSIGRTAVNRVGRYTTPIEVWINCTKSVKYFQHSRNART